MAKEPPVGKLPEDVLPDWVKQNTPDDGEFLSDLKADPVSPDLELPAWVNIQTDENPQIPS